MIWLPATFLTSFPIILPLTHPISGTLHSLLFLLTKGINKIEKQFTDKNALMASIQILALHQRQNVFQVTRIRKISLFQITNSLLN